MDLHESARIGQEVTILTNMVKSLNIPLGSDAAVLDFGCGSGELAYELRKQGIKTFGIDILDYHGEYEQKCRDEGLTDPHADIFATIDLANYRIPYPDNTFDLVFSFQVFEHVQNWPEALAEIKRVLKPGGYSLHIVPSRHRIIEGHVHVPFGSVFRGQTYLSLWARLGIRNDYQRDLSWREVAAINHTYLTTETKYHPRPAVKKIVQREFGNLRFVEEAYLDSSGGRFHRYYPRFKKTLPLLPRLYGRWYSTFNSHAILSQKR